ncbi:MAG: helix-turn-helix domain-containing protein [Pseudomonadota bacterium]
MDGEADKRIWTATAMTALSHPRRVAILETLQRDAKGLSFEELLERTGLTISTLTHHLRPMKAAKLVISKRKGHRVALYIDGGAVLKTLASLQSGIEAARSPKRPKLAAS